MRLPIKIGENVELVMTKDKYGYSEVIDSMEKAEFIRIVTYNISKKYSDDLLKHLEDCPDVKIVSNIPEVYYKYNSPSVKENAINFYTTKLNPDRYNICQEVFFNFKNHCKIVMTDTVAYIGSGNFSRNSENNFECGVIIRDKNIIKEIDNKFIDMLIKESYEYHDSEYTRLYEYAWYARGKIVRLNIEYSDWVASIMYLNTYKPQDLTTFDASLSPKLLKSIVELSHSLYDLIYNLNDKYPSVFEESWLDKSTTICSDIINYFKEKSELEIYSTYHANIHSDEVLYIPGDYSFSNGVEYDDAYIESYNLFKYKNYSRKIREIDYYKISGISKQALDGQELLKELDECINSLYKKITEKMDKVNKLIYNT